VFELETTLSSWSKVAEYTGLSEYEAKVYLALIDLGVAGARKLSLTCEVPRSKVYNTLKKLIEQGLVMEVPGRPKSFMAVAPDVSLKPIFLLVKKRAEEFESLLRTLTEAYRRRRERVVPRKVDVWTIRGRRRILERMRRLLLDARRSVEIVTNENGGVLFFKVANKILDKLKEEGVKVNFLSPLDPEKQLLARELSYICDVESVDFRLPLLYVGIDHSRFMLMKMIPNSLEVESESDVALFSEDPTLLSMISSLLLGYASSRREKPEEREGKLLSIPLLQRLG